MEAVSDEGDRADENFVSQKDGDFFAELYKSYGLKGGHIILLNPASSEYYDADVRQAQLALAAYPGGLQIGGGINADNAGDYLASPKVLCCGGSWMVKKSLIQEKNFDKIEQLVREAAAIRKEVFPWA